VDIRKKTHLFCIGGESGIIKIININSGLVIGYMKGHTGAIMSMKAVKNILVTCSEDRTIRIWNVASYACIGVLGGIHGHKDSVLSIDVREKLDRIVSCGIDATIKQWEIQIVDQNEEDANKSATKAEASDKSPASNRQSTGKNLLGSAFIYKSEPNYNFQNVHRGEISQVKYYGNFITSLSNNTITVIYDNAKMEGELGALDKSTPVFIGAIELYDSCKKFLIEKNILIAVGAAGDVYVYDLRGIRHTKTPFILEYKMAGIEDFTVADNGTLFMTAGTRIARMQIDIDRFESSREYL